MTGLPIMGPTGVPYRSPTGVRGGVVRPDYEDIYFGMYRGGTTSYQTTSIIRWNSTEQVYEDIGATLPISIANTSSVRAMCMWRGKLVVSLGVKHSLFFYDNDTWVELPYAGDGLIETMVSYDDDLYVGGSIRSVGGVTVKRIARYDGTEWHAVGPNPGRDASGPCHSLVVFGGELYAGGFQMRLYGSPIDDPPFEELLEFNVNVMRLKSDDTWERVNRFTDTGTCYKLKVHRGIGDANGTLTRYVEFGTLFPLATAYRLQLWSGIVDSDWFSVSPSGSIVDFESYGLNLAYVYTSGGSTKSWEGGDYSTLPGSFTALGHLQEELIGGTGFGFDAGNADHRGPWRYQESSESWLPVGLRSQPPESKLLPSIRTIESVKRSSFTAHADQPVI